MRRPVFDGRHKWGPAEPSTHPGWIIQRTCTVCERVSGYDTLVPRAFVDALMKHLTAPNPYRAMFR